MIFVFRVLTWKISPGIISSTWNSFRVLWIVNHFSVLESEGSVAIDLKTPFFGFNVTLPALIIKYIKLYYLGVAVVFTYKTNACKFSTSFNFYGKKNFPFC